MNILKLFEQKGALLKGHFLLTSGLHSNKYFQCALLLQYPDIAGKIAELLVKKLLSGISNINCVLSPAVGGIVIGQEIARILRCRAIFTERVEGKMTLRRGFNMNDCKNILVVEDVVTTGSTTKELIQLTAEEGAKAIAACSIVDRGTGIDLGIPFVSLCKLKIDTFPRDNCPMCKEGIPLVKPGSRKQSK
jgi:orotate phosphoribosyltransferase